jgi:hypothetical protein
MFFPLLLWRRGIKGEEAISSNFDQSTQDTVKNEQMASSPQPPSSTVRRGSCNEKLVALEEDIYLA